MDMTPSTIPADNNLKAILEQNIIQAETGIFISDKAMCAWVNSWGSPDELPAPEANVFMGHRPKAP